MKTVYRRSVTECVSLKEVKFFFIFILSFINILSFTSCKSDSPGILGKQTALTNNEDPDIKNAPFAYDIVLDTISYNSCLNNTGASDYPIFGIKAGASEGFADNLGTGAVKSGLKLRTDFLKYVGQKFTPDYPSDTITGKQIMKILNQSYSIFNSNAYLQIAVRNLTDLSAVPDVIIPSASTPAEVPRDVFTFSKVLSDGYLGNILSKKVSYNTAGLVLKEGDRIYNLSEIQEPIPIEAQFGFNATTDSTLQTQTTLGVAEQYSQKVRDTFSSGKQILTASFGGLAAAGVLNPDASTPTINTLKRPYKSGTTTPNPSRAYGKGYSLKFESKSIVPTWPKNLLTQVNEFNLEDGSPVGGTSWSCEYLPIVPKNYWNNNKAINPNYWINSGSDVEPNCAPLLSDDISCSIFDTASICSIKKTRAEQIQRIRRHYSPENWNIGVLFPNADKNLPPPTRSGLSLCVSPKQGECYLPTTQILSTAAETSKDIGIQFNRGKDCYLSSNASTQSDTQKKWGRCAQYASICVRNSSNY